MNPEQPTDTSRTVDTVLASRYWLTDAGYAVLAVIEGQS